MSVLETPRVYFRGEVSWDPITTNNYRSNYDEADCEAVFDGQAGVDGFRQSAIKQVETGGNWNPDGSHRAMFFETAICGVDTGAGTVTEDPFVGAPIEFAGMLVDAEPYGATSSQLFFDDISLGIPGGCRILGLRMDRFTARYINFSRNPSNSMIAGVASVVWQTCFPKDGGLIIDAHDSPALQALVARLADDDVRGIMVRWNSYRTVYYDDEQLSNGSPAAAAAAKALVAKLDGGGFQPNPARSLIVGTAGLWCAHDPVHEPAGRALITTGQGVNNAPAVGSAHAHFSDSALTVDLANSIPEKDRTPEKFDLGTLSIDLLDSADHSKVLATIATMNFAQYDAVAYQASAGIVTLPISAEHAALAKSNPLRLRAADNTVLLVETPVRAVPTVPNLYIDQGNETRAKVQVYVFGAPAGADLPVTMAQIGATQPVGDQQKTDANGEASFRVIGSKGMVVAYAFLPGENPELPLTADEFNPQVYTYLTLRVLPADEAIARLAPTWDNVHRYVLVNWQAMAPCMDNWLRLGDEAQVMAYGPMLRKLTAPDNFEAFRYMPVTRDMTPGQRTLLYRFLDGETAVLAEGTPKFGTLSRRMRRS